ncbi:MAG: Lrp/AsnC family transcriptional regulator [Anaerolineae bacterium]|jgi:Lrp/AsnC family leucine-responsive transcriptional regulator|nr:Lrp/AsnC family transcriptional regulator [Anaerolineae bacterium]
MKQYSVDLDAQDILLLNVLQQDSSISNVKLAERVNLSPPATLARVRRLENLGLIRRYVALLDTDKLGYDMVCFITVSLQIHQPDEVSRFRAAIKQMPEVLECYHVTGDYDYILKVVVHNRQELQLFLMDRLTPLPCVGRIQTRVVLDELKSTTALPLPAPD